MNYELTTLFGLGSGYLLLLFAIAFITERGWIPEKIVRHPINCGQKGVGVHHRAASRWDRFEANYWRQAPFLLA